jgi:2-C-methyl-D-erythritol 4-phosphate cytidylyltransferase
MNSNARPRVVVVIPAAGSGSRFGGDVPKQFRLLAGKPIVQRVLERFILDDRVDRVVIAVSEMLLSSVKQTADDRVQFVAGGETRLQSVVAGVEKAGECDLIAVHDSVRPFFAPETFHAVLDAAAETGAALPVFPLAETIHQLEAGRIVATPDRSALVAAQTPQCFRSGILRDVLARAVRESDDATDEAGLAARYGYEVRAVPGDSLNFKITRPEDLAMAERVMSEWGAEE